ncbi:MAG: hypothetical protein MHPSP_001524, partial [Paramarteilia canceri]
ATKIKSTEADREAGEVEILRNKLEKTIDELTITRSNISLQNLDNEKKLKACEQAHESQVQSLNTQLLFKQQELIESRRNNMILEQRMKALEKQREHMSQKKLSLSLQRTYSNDSVENSLTQNGTIISSMSNQVVTFNLSPSEINAVSNYLLNT